MSPSKCTISPLQMEKKKEYLNKQNGKFGASGIKE